MNETKHAPPPGSSPACDVLCLGETMVMVTPDIPVELTAENARLRLHVGGAESNVAMGLAQLGVPTVWWSRVGDDALGRYVAERIADLGVKVSVVRDPARPTGVYFKDITPEGTRVMYYRRDSAASAMGPADAELLPPWRRLLHVSGITPALSASADDLLEALLTGPRPDGGLVSFDINHRGQLWPRDIAAARLAELGTHADIVFVGLDEAAHLWGVRSPAELRAVFPGVGELVVKDGPREASVVTADDIVSVPTPPIDVHEVVGAGDAFAAGYLSALLDGVVLPRRLMAGHLAAREAIQVTGDVPVLPRLSELLSRAEEHWDTASTVITLALSRNATTGAAS
ncbi:sugar kinase [Microbacterium sp. RD1]|uniref:sugar kinase n=1 Tax=Microbacterium sp. RD1 TaxID=3457313 RepID=UPI003FA592D5